MQRAGWAALEVIPSLRGFESSLNSQTNPVMARSGVAGGGKFGDAAGRSMSSRFLSHAKTAAILAGGVLTGVAAVAIHIGRNSISEAREAQRVGAITTRVIKSTGQAAHVTAKEVGHLSTAISNRVGIDDEAIQSGANLLLTFKGIRNEVGKGNNIFDQATQITTDMAVAMAGGGEVNLKSSAIQVGKALNDPVKGLTALTRVGVTFDAQQQKQIKSLVAQGKTMQAQKLILGELKSEFGGTAAAQATMGDKVKVAWGNVEENIGTALLPLIDDLERAFLKKGVPALNKFSNWFSKDGTKGIESFVKQAEPLAHSILPAAKTGLKDIAGFLRDAAGPAKTVFDAFNSLPGWAQKAVVLGGAGGFIAKKSGALDLGLKVLGRGGGALGAVRGATPIDPLFVSVVGGGLPGAGGGAGSPIITAGKTAEGTAAVTRTAFAAKAAKAAADAVKAAGGSAEAATAESAKVFREAMAAHDAAVLKGAFSFGGKVGLRSILGAAFSAPASVTLGAAGAEVPTKGRINSLAGLSGVGADWSKIDKTFTHMINSGNLSGVQDEMFQLATLAARMKGSDNPAVGFQELDALLPKTNAKIDRLTAGSQVAGRGFRQLGMGANSTLDQVTTRTEVLDAKLRGLPKSLRTKIDVDTTAAEQRIRNLRAMAGRHISAELSIELAGRGPSQRALDGVRR